MGVPHRSAWAVASLVVGIVGIAVGWLPFVGRIASLVCGAAAVVCGVVGMRRAAFDERGSGHALAVAGLALGCACLFDAVRGFGCTAATSAVFGVFGS